MSEVSNDSHERVCPACGGHAAFRRGQKNNFAVFSCRTCSTLYALEITNFNPEQIYDSYYTSENLTVPVFVAGRLDEIVATFEPYRKNNRLLDVGFGAGSFLEAAARNSWQAFGVEVSQTAVAHVQGRGFEVFCGELGEAAYTDDYFDVIVASEVLEHVTAPRTLLEEIARVLRPGGLLWATTPHGRGISARLLGLDWSIVCPPEHLQLFSLNSIRDFLSSGGFRQVELDTRGTNPYELVHGLYQRRFANTQPEPDAGGVDFDRVESSYQLNESLSGNRAGRIIKGIVNALLNAGRLGDSIRIRAEK